MQDKATSKFVRVSPFKIRPLANVVRGSKVDKALSWLKFSPEKRAVPLMKTIHSAYSNAVNKMEGEQASMSDFIIKEVRIDGGPTVKYYKPGAMGRSNVQRRRTSHVHVVVEKLSNLEK